MSGRARRTWRGRLPFVVLAAVGVLVVAGLTASALEGSVTYYRTPTEVLAHPSGDAVRLGGMVVVGSVTRRDGQVRFDVTDGAHDVPVVTHDRPPGTFREGQGVVVEGRLGADEVFAADQVLVRHSNEYQPPGSRTP